jgi:hypothetical protein
MSEYVATEDEGTRPVPGEPGDADDAPGKDTAMQPAPAGTQAGEDVARTADTAGPARSAALDVRQPLRRSPACERKR